MVWQPAFEDWIVTKRLDNDGRFKSNEPAITVWNDIYQDLLTSVSPIPPNLVALLNGEKLQEKFRTLRVAVTEYYTACK